MIDVPLEIYLKINKKCYSYFCLNMQGVILLKEILE